MGDGPSLRVTEERETTGWLHHPRGSTRLLRRSTPQRSAAAPLFGDGLWVDQALGLAGSAEILLLGSREASEIEQAADFRAE